MNLSQLKEIVFNICQLDLARPLLVGVSGGPDSLCLLDSLVQLGFPVIVAHFDHQLRADSSADAQVVQQAAERYSMPFILGSQDVSAYVRETGLSIEAAARSLRYRFLFARAREHHAQAVAVGHTADDQVETILMHLLRGAGLTGLKGMSCRSFNPDWDPDIPLVRPLLATWRAETLAYCRERRQEPVFDPSNQDTAFFRNQIRHELIPFLETLNPKIRENLCRTAQLLAADEAVVQSAVQSAWESCRAESGENAVSLWLPAFKSLDLGLQRGVLRRAIMYLLPGLQNLDFAAVERGLGFIRASNSGQVDLVHGLRLLLENDRLWITGAQMPDNPAWPQLSQAEIPLAVPCEMDVSPGWRMSAVWEEFSDLPDFSGAGDFRWQAWFDADTLPADLCLRRPRMGDRFLPLGMDGRAIKLSDFWINQKLPRRARVAWPLLASGEAILWVPGFRAAHPYRITASTQKVLNIKLFPVK